MTLEITDKDVSSSERIKLVKSVLEKGTIDKPSLIKKTGLSPLVLEEAIKILMKVYPCHLEINEDRNLVYSFDFRRSYAKKLSWLIQIKNIAKQAFLILTWLMPILYLLFFILLTLNSENFSRRSLEAAQHGLFSDLVITLAFNIVLYLAVLALQVVFLWIPYFIFHYLLKFILKRWNHKRTPKQWFFIGQKVESFHKNKNLLTAVRDYIFGKKQEEDKLWVERLILNYIQKNDFCFNIAQLCKLTGWSRYKAEEEATHFLANYNGTVEINEKGFVEFHFPDLKSNTTHLAEVAPVWERKPKLLRWNNNPRALNALITLFHHFVLLVSVFYLFLIIDYTMTEEKAAKSSFFFNKYQPSEIEQSINTFLPEGMDIFLIYVIIPYVIFAYCNLFFLIFIVGKKQMLRKNQYLLQEQDYYFSLEAIFSNPEKVYLPENRYSKRAIQEFGGEVALDEHGKKYYHFHQLTLELKDS